MGTMTTRRNMLLGAGALGAAAAIGVVPAVATAAPRRLITQESLEAFRLAMMPHYIRGAEAGAREAEGVFMDWATRRLRVARTDGIAILDPSNGLARDVTSILDNLANRQTCSYEMTYAVPSHVIAGLGERHRMLEVLFEHFATEVGRFCAAARVARVTTASDAPWVRGHIAPELNVIGSQDPAQLDLWEHFATTEEAEMDSGFSRRPRCMRLPPQFLDRGLHWDVPIGIAITTSRL